MKYVSDKETQHTKQVNTGRYHPRREWRILALVCYHLDTPLAALFSGTDPQAIHCRRLLCYVLARAGYTIADISQALNQRYVHVLQAVLYVEARPALEREGRRLLEIALPVDQDDCERTFLDTATVALIVQQLAHELGGLVSPRDSGAVRAYVGGTLLGRPQSSGAQAIWGLWMLGRHAAARTIVDDVLRIWGLGSYVGLIDLHLQRTGR
jgi:hypothetical protein